MTNSKIKVEITQHPTVQLLEKIAKNLYSLYVKVDQLKGGIDDEAYQKIEELFVELFSDMRDRNNPSLRKEIYIDPRELSE